ncbi:MAG: alpha/beta hydrolase [Flavobacteriaceae bacterium]|nr:alpha/beta hydrolase [Flavobacteriaceae bacterium]MCY4268189.1 alpha/beta hydrolase [Flavobacteriaceae bacterium]
MTNQIREVDQYRFVDVGQGQPIVLLHGLMGTLSNFDGILDFFPDKGYRILIPDLPFYSMSIHKTSVASLSKYLFRFFKRLSINHAILLGNSLGGHVALMHARDYQEFLSGIVITGSSGLYENNIGGNAAPNRKNYQYIKSKAEEVFYDPSIATKEIVDSVYETVNDNMKLIRTIALAKSAIRHNMAKELTSIGLPAAIIWGKQDVVTPPDVAEEFHKLLPNSDLYWIDKCGHAPMMEHPTIFNDLLIGWLHEREL